MRVDLRVAAAILSCLALASVWPVMPPEGTAGVALGAGGQAGLLALVAVALLVGHARDAAALAAAVAAIVLAGALVVTLRGDELVPAVPLAAAAAAALAVTLIFLAARPGPRAALDAGVIAAAAVGALHLVDSDPEPTAIGVAFLAGLAGAIGLLGLRPFGVRRDALVAAGAATGATALVLGPETEILNAVVWLGIALAAPALFPRGGEELALAPQDLTIPVILTATLLAAGLAASGAIGGSLLVCWSILGVALARVAWGALRDRSAVGEISSDGTRDPVTGLGNRDAFRQALATHLAGDAESSLLVVFDLHGFKHYNDAYGELAGDGVLRHLAERLRAATWPARAFRLRGDEFAVISDFADGRAEAVLDRAESALTISGNGFAIGAHVGAVVIPDETTDAGRAMRIADQRILIQRRSSGSDHRWDELDRHIAEARAAVEKTSEAGEADLAALALAVGAQLDLGNDDLLDLARAASLHNLGRVAVPTTASGAVAPGRGGEVDRNRHLIGERLLASAPDMREAAAIVRSIREHWDGSGEPDGLEGADIPVGARVLAVCEAYRSARLVHRAGEADPLQSLHGIAAGGGTRFDPWVIAGLRSALERGSETGADGERRLP